VLVCRSSPEPLDLGAYTSGTEIEGVAAELDGKMPTIGIPMRFQRRVGAKRIIAPDAREIARTTKPQPDGTQGARAGVALAADA
jgi:hypothetical protein